MNISSVRIEDIQVNTRSRNDVGNLLSLQVSIHQVGLLHPLILNSRMELIAGYRRLSAVKQLGWESVPCIVAERLDDALAALKAELDENVCRLSMSPTEISELGRRIEEIEKPEAKRRSGMRTDLPQPVGKLPTGSPGRTNDKVAEAVGVSRRTYEKIKQVAEAAEKEPERFGDLPARMDEQSVDAAHKEMRRRQQVPSDDPPPLPESEALDYPDPEEDDTEPSQFEDDLADDDEPDTRSPVCEGCGEPYVYCRCGDQADELIDGSKFTYDVSLGKWVPRTEALEVPQSEGVRQSRAEKAAQREATRLDSLERRAALAPVSASWEIRLGDCIEGLNAFCNDQREAGTARLVFADPPYNIGWDYGDGAQADSLDGDRFVEWCGLWMDLARDTLTADGSFWLLIGDEFAAELKVTAEEVGFHLRQWLIWYEAFGVNCSGKFNRTHRHLFHFVVDPENFVFNANAPEVRRPSDRQEKYDDPRASAEGKLWDSVWGIKPAIPRVCGTHAEAIPGSPAPQLPLALLRPIIACASNPGDLVLDPFCGNATTGAAALQLGRRFLGFEKRQPIFDLATLRLKATVADLARKEN